MAPGNYRRIKANGITFVFKYDPADPTLLHIFVRHLKTPREAMRVWFQGHHEYNRAHRRFEAVLEGVRVTWFPINLQENVFMIVSCHDLREE